MLVSFSVGHPSPGVRLGNLIALTHSSGDLLASSKLLQATSPAPLSLESALLSLEVPFALFESTLVYLE